MYAYSYFFVYALLYLVWLMLCNPEEVMCASTIHINLFEQANNKKERLSQQESMKSVPKKRLLSVQSEAVARTRTQKEASSIVLPAE